MAAVADPVPDLLDPRSAHDAGWESRVRSLPADARGRLLDRAGDLLAVGEVERRRAVACLRALKDDLDPMDPEAAGRILRFLPATGPDPSFESLFRRASLGAADLDLELEGAVIAGQFAVTRGDLSEAERLYRSVLARANGSGRRAERAAAANYARLCLEAGREFEALTLARRAAMLAEAGGDDWGIALSHLYVCTVLRTVRDWERLRRAIPPLEAFVARLPEARRRRILYSIHGHKAALALSRGDADGCLAELDAAAALTPKEGWPLTDARTPLVARASALVRSGRPLEAAPLLAKAAALGSLDDRQGIEIRCHQVACALSADGGSEAARLAGPVLDDMESEAGRASGPARRIEHASQLGWILRKAPGAEVAARRAYDVAAAAAVERLIELDRFVRECPDLATAEPEDLLVLADFRRRTLDAQGEMHRAVARLFEAAAAAGRTMLPMLESDADYTCVCAWCQRVRAHDGTWLSMQQFLPLQPAGRIRLTHGICPACAPRLSAEIRQQGPPRPR